MTERSRTNNHLSAYRKSNMLHLLRNYTSSQHVFISRDFMTTSMFEGVRNALIPPDIRAVIGRYEKTQHANMFVRMNRTAFKFKNSDSVVQVGIRDTAYGNELVGFLDNYDTHIVDTGVILELQAAVDNYNQLQADVQHVTSWMDKVEAYINTPGQWARVWPESVVLLPPEEKAVIFGQTRASRLPPDWSQPEPDTAKKATSLLMQWKMAWSDGGTVGGVDSEDYETVFQLEHLR